MYEGKGHIIARLVFTSAYIWCDDYVRSPNFAASFHINPPACPNGDLGTEYDRTDMLLPQNKTHESANRSRQTTSPALSAPTA